MVSATRSISFGPEVGVKHSTCTSTPSARHFRPSGSTCSLSGTNTPSLFGPWPIKARTNPSSTSDGKMTGYLPIHSVNDPVHITTTADNPCSTSALKVTSPCFITARLLIVTSSPDGNCVNNASASVSGVRRSISALERPSSAPRKSISISPPRTARSSRSTSERGLWPITKAPKRSPLVMMTPPTRTG